MTTTKRTDAEIAEWMNSAEYERRERVLDDLVAQGPMPSIEFVALLLDLPLDIASGLVRAVRDPEGFADYQRRRRQLQ